MPNRHRYLVDYPVDPYFPYIALAPWPHSLEHQLDWINQIETVESWLHQYIGAHYSAWVWASQQEQQYWQACVAFQLEKHKSLFLLQWAR